MVQLTKFPEGIPVDVRMAAIAGWHPWQIGEDMVVKIMLIGGAEIHVTETMAEVRTRFPRDF